MKKGKKHTGKVTHSNMTSLHASTSMSGRDPHAHPSHHEMNKKHGTPMGFHPMDESDSEGGSGGNAIPDMDEGSNCEEC